MTNAPYSTNILTASPTASPRSLKIITLTRRKLTSDHQQPSSCYASATDTTIVVTRTNQPPLIQPSIAADSGNNSEASTASSTHPLATSTNNSTVTATNSTTQPVAGQSLLSIADDVSDSADSEYRSLEANDQEDSDSAVAPLPLAGSAGRE
uniref:Uncharacterized protein n=1 Tax=Anopheles merus TaxID=30066 RepID=A0A182UM47_ANOME